MKRRPQHCRPECVCDPEASVVARARGRIWKDSLRPGATRVSRVCLLKCVGGVASRGRERQHVTSVKPYMLGTFPYVVQTRHTRLLILLLNYVRETNITVQVFIDASREIF